MAMNFSDIIQDKEKLELFQGKVAEYIKSQNYERNAAIIKAAAELGCELTEEQISDTADSFEDRTSLSLNDLNQVAGGTAVAIGWNHDYALLCVD